MVKKVNRENTALIGSKDYGNKELYLNNISLIPKVQSMSYPKFQYIQSTLYTEQFGKNEILKD